MLLVGRVAMLVIAVFAIQAFSQQSTLTAQAMPGAKVFQLPRLDAGTVRNGCTTHQRLVVRSLSSAKASQLKTTCGRAMKHLYKVKFWTAKQHNWTLYLRHTQQSCGQLARRDLLVGPQKLCLTARRQVAYHGNKFAKLASKIRRLAGVAAWQGDLAASAGRRACIASVETYGSSHPYTQQQLGGGDYWGKYQYNPGTWQTAVRRASAYYGLRLPLTATAAQAAPWQQEVVTAFAITHPTAMGWDPWAECR